MGKPSSTISAKVAYEAALTAGFRPAVINPHERMHSLAWDAIKNHRNVQHSGSGDSIILVDTVGDRQPLTLITKGMLGEGAVIRFEQAGINLR